LVTPETTVVDAGDLATWEGYTSNVVAAWQTRPTLDYLNMIADCALNAAEKLVPDISLWSPLNLDKKRVPKTEKKPIGEAGIYDDMGHLPLLIRKVKKIVIFDSASIPPDTVDQPGADKVTLEANVYLKAAFGQPGALGPNPPGAPNPMMAENYLSVFNSSDFPVLWSKMNSLKEQGQPVVVRQNVSVVDNPHFGIEGGWTAEIVFVVATPVPEFYDALPNETKTILSKKIAKDKAFFPNVGVNDPQSKFELTALSQYASWITKKAVVAEIKAMLGPKPMTTSMSPSTSTTPATTSAITSATTSASPSTQLV